MFNQYLYANANQGKPSDYFNFIFKNHFATNQTQKPKGYPMVNTGNYNVCWSSIFTVVFGKFILVKRSHFIKQLPSDREKE